MDTLLLVPMPFLLLKQTELINPNVPSSAVIYIDQTQWHSIFVAFDDAKKEAACCTTITTFLLCACMCKDSILFSQMLSGSLPKRLLKVNQDHFWGKPVIQVRNNAIVIQTDYIIERQNAGIQAHGSAHHVPEAHAVPVPENYPSPHYIPVPHKEPEHHNEHHNQHQEHHQHMPQPPLHRKMDVIVPPGAPPGSVLSVQDPAGQIVQVTVPPGVTAGMKLEFQY